MRRMKTYSQITPLAGRADPPLAACKPAKVLSTDPQFPAARNNSNRQGMTLVELLVVTVLLSILVTTAIPVISPNNDSRKIREASRSINAYLAAAQAKAIETGRPYGVEFTRLSDSTGSGEDNGACIQLTQIEVPPHYTGIDSRSVARIKANETASGYLDPSEPYSLQFIRRDDTSAGNSLPPGYAQDLFPPSTIRPNDILEYKGQRFYVISNNTDDNGYCTANGNNIKQIGLGPIQYHVSEDGPTAQDAAGWERLDIVPSYSATNGWATQVLPYLDETSIDINSDSGADYWTEPASYKIERQPTPSSAEPLQLPAGMAIDMTSSGVDLDDNTSGRFYLPSTDPDDIQVSQSPRLVFKPSGQAWIHLPGKEPRPITGNLTLCVGRVELVNYEIEEEYGQNTQDDPIDLTAVYDAIPESDTVAIREITDKYNWLNMDSRWVVVSGRSGSITTVPNSFVNPDTSNLRDIHDDNRFGIDEQLLTALLNAPTRTSAGGR